MSCPWTDWVGSSGCHVMTAKPWPPSDVQQREWGEVTLRGYSWSPSIQQQGWLWSSTCTVYWARPLLENTDAPSGEVRSGWSTEPLNMTGLVWCREPFWQLDRDLKKIWKVPVGFSVFLTLISPTCSTGNSSGREWACVSGSDGCGGSGGLGFIWKILCQVASIFIIFLPSQMCYSPFFRMRKLRFGELCTGPAWKSWAGFRNPFSRTPICLNTVKCKVTKLGLGAEWSGDEGPVHREVASLSIGPVCGQSWEVLHSSFCHPENLTFAGVGMS